MVCPKCGAEIPEGSTVCTKCGGQLVATATQPAARFCQHCGSAISDGSTICTVCGTRIVPAAAQPATKFCQHCGAIIDKECIICPRCGKQVAQLQQEQPQVVINNSNNNVNSNVNANTGGRYPKPKNKWVAFLLCLFLGGLGAHKFYEGKILLGILYLLTFGIFGIGWLVSLISLLFKPNPYYV